MRQGDGPSAGWATARCLPFPFQPPCPVIQVQGVHLCLFRPLNWCLGNPSGTAVGGRIITPDKELGSRLNIQVIMKPALRPGAPGAGMEGGVEGASRVAEASLGLLGLVFCQVLQGRGGARGHPCPRERSEAPLPFLFSAGCHTSCLPGPDSASSPGIWHFSTRYENP